MYYQILGFIKLVLVLAVQSVDTLTLKLLVHQVFPYTLVLFALGSIK